MIKEEIMTASFEEIEARSQEIANEVETLADNADELEARADELEAIEERKNQLAAEAEERNAQAEEIANSNTVEVRETVENTNKENTKMFGIESNEYRNAFMANLVNNANEEQRSILADNSAYGDGLSLPVALDTQIWDQITQAHPILSDITTINAGMPIKVTKMTPAAIAKKKDSDASAEQTFTGVDVTLVGADYHTYVTLSYAEAKMSQGAMEKFLVKEIADAIGEALAKDVFARILADATTAQGVTATTDMFADIKSCLALAKQATNPVIYAPSSSYFEIVGAVKSGTPFNIGATLGCQVKLDNAATKVTVVDPSKFVLDVVQGTMIESERDAKNAQIVIGGYMRAEGCLRKTTAAAYIK